MFQKLIELYRKLDKIVQERTAGLEAGSDSLSDSHLISANGLFIDPETGFDAHGGTVAVGTSTSLDSD
jgi:hypothetical protein